MFTKKYDWASKDILDQFEVNYEVVEKVIFDIKRRSIDDTLNISKSGDWYYYCYEELTNKELKHITKVLRQRYNITVIDSCLSYDLFNIPHITFKLHIKS